jgi:hypothetical protein
MSFFKTSDGEKIQAEKSFDASGGYGEPIPDNVNVLACVDKIEWRSYEGVESISVQWGIVQPKEYANRKVFQNLKVNDAEPKKKDKALRMLAAIDAMHGGKLMALNAAPNDEQMAAALLNKLSVLKIGAFDIEGKKGNYVKAVAERKAVGSADEVKSPAPRTAKSDSFDDDIPF